MKYRFIILLFSLFYCTFVFSQSDRAQVRDGNKLYDKEHYTEAEIKYRKALEENNKSTEANFNLGNSLYKQGKYDKAREQYELVAHMAKEPSVAASAYHNIGNSYMEEKKYKEAAEAYKNALRKNPKDDETRYNLAMASSMLQKTDVQQEQGQDEDQEQDQEQESQQQQLQQQQSDQLEQQDMSKENARQILDAFAEDEKDLLEKINKNNFTPIDTRKPDKDW